MKILKVVGLCVLLIVAAVAAKRLLESDFDRLAKEMIREQGHRSDQQEATDAVLKFLRDNNIDDPLAYFDRYGRGKVVLHADDPNLSVTDRKWVESENAKTLSSYQNKYFHRILTNYRVNIRVWDMPSGERTVTAQIYYDSP